MAFKIIDFITNGYYQMTENNRPYNPNRHTLDVAGELLPDKTSTGATYEERKQYNLSLLDAITARDKEWNPDPIVFEESIKFLVGNPLSRLMAVTQARLASSGIARGLEKVFGTNPFQRDRAADALELAGQIVDDSNRNEYLAWGTTNDLSGREFYRTKHALNRASKPNFKPTRSLHEATEQLNSVRANVLKREYGTDRELERMSFLQDDRSDPVQPLTDGQPRDPKSSHSDPAQAASPLPPAHGTAGVRGDRINSPPVVERDYAELKRQHPPEIRHDHAPSMQSSFSSHASSSTSNPNSRRDKNKMHVSHVPQTAEYNRPPKHRSYHQLQTSPRSHTAPASRPTPRVRTPHRSGPHSPRPGL
jgi:hypothetical protein